MLTAPSSESARRVTPRRGARAWFALPIVLLAGSCLLDIPPLENAIGGGGAAGDGGSTGLTGGASSGSGGSIISGGSAGTSVSRPCPEGQKLCGEICRPETPEFGCASASCDSCGSAPNTQVACVEGQCAVLGCDPGYADCNGNVLKATAPFSGDGCEYSLGLPAANVTTLDVPFRHILVDGSRADWSDIPSYGLDQLCPECKDDNTLPVSADASVPPRNDLDARFRVAWDGNSFYVLVEAFDNQLFSAGVVGNKCDHGSECEDSVQLIFAGRNNRGQGYFNDNDRLFLGLSQRSGAPAQAQPQAGDVEVQVEPQGSLCYRLEAHVDWAYITSRNLQADPAFFPPKPGSTYGFQIAVNDWDSALSDDTLLQRQSQVFWVLPGPLIARQPDGAGTLLLLGPSDAGL